jgi:hypothetical protein
LAGQQNDSQNHEIKGYITKEAIYLENQLLNNLKSVQPGEKVQEFKFQHVGETFNQVIKKDKNFGRLLHKIKAAYDSYVEQIQNTK